MIFGDLAALVRKSFDSKGSGYAPVRVPFRIWSDLSLDRNELISMLINPQTVGVAQTKRTVEHKTQAGSTFLHFSDENGRNNDLFVLTFRGLTGNIRSFVRKKAGGLQPLPDGFKKLLQWAQLWSLSRDPILDVRKNKEIMYYIEYASPAIPLPVVFAGHFSAPLTFEDSAERPFMVDWTFQFTVHDTFPPIDELYWYIGTDMNTYDGMVKATQDKSILELV